MKIKWTEKKFTGAADAGYICYYMGIKLFIAKCKCCTFYSCGFIKNGQAVTLNQDLTYEDSKEWIEGRAPSLVGGGEA